MVASNYFKNRFRKGKGKAKVKMAPPAKPKQTFAQKVNQIIARNVENKLTTSYTNTSPICTIPASGTLQWFLLKDWNTKLFTISQGAAEQQRIGNQIKLKRWVIKGMIHPTSTGGVSTNIVNTQQGFVDIYFGRLVTNGELTTALTALYDNGNTSVAPIGAMSQIFMKLNKDEYKVYYHKRFKVAPSISQGGQQTLSNNDFALVKTFGFDVTKYICKNASIKFNDADNDANNAMIRQLAMWATWTPAYGDMATTAAVEFSRTHFYNITIQSYAEYEDA